MNDIATRKAAIPLKPASRRRPTQAEAEEAVRILIAWAGDDPAREGLKDFGAGAGAGTRLRTERDIPTVFVLGGSLLDTPIARVRPR
jgi:hypothetical protein